MDILDISLSAVKINVFGLNNFYFSDFSDFADCGNLNI